MLFLGCGQQYYPQQYSGAQQYQTPQTQQAFQQPIQQPVQPGSQQLPATLPAEVHEAWIGWVMLDMSLIYKQKTTIPADLAAQLNQYLDQIYAQGDYQTKVAILSLPQIVAQIYATMEKAGTEQLVAYRQSRLEFYGMQDPFAGQQAGGTSNSMVNSMLQNQMVAQHMQLMGQYNSAAMSAMSGQYGSQSYNYYSGYG